ncbi:MAG TPA: DUF1566 domain-containing protein [Candidatus Brocadiaceae bacterium]|nr:DUF1566 domain-containing protein [Candidatus Brocadiaceae bacterium]
MVLSQKLISRYRELKQEAKDCILLMQVGAFMQVMDTDANPIATNGIEASNGGGDRRSGCIGRFSKIRTECLRWGYGQGVQSNNYWSGTTYPNNTTNAWNVNLNNGNVNNDNKTNTNYVWPVRAGE